MSEPIISLYHPEQGYDYIIKWEGNKKAVFSVYQFVDMGIRHPIFVGDKYNSNGFVFEILELGCFGYCVTVLRIDNIISHHIYKWKFLFYKWLCVINERILLTLQIWNLLHYEPGTKLSWRNLKLLRKSK